MTGIPIWLLDIDGVINALDDPPDPRSWPADQWVRSLAMSNLDLEWPMLAARPVLDFLRRVHEQGRAEIHWHTSWQRNALNVGDALGLPAWPIAPCPEFDRSRAQIAVPLTTRVSHWWKLPAAQRVLDSGRPLLWTDDDTRYQLRRADIAAWGDSVLVIAPAAGRGLTPKHLKQIDAWLPPAA